MDPGRFRGSVSPAFSRAVAALSLVLSALVFVSRASAEPKAPAAPAAAPAPAASAPAPATGADEEVLPSPSLPALPPAASSDVPAEPAPAGATAPAANEAAQVNDRDPRALNEWRAQLDGYGTWVDDPKYGRVWVPDRTVVGEGFSPYVTSGHWALDTENNWVWVSDFSFGNIVFHYGRWVWTDYGWSWVPGYQYSPAWVVWRVPTGSYAYLGWAPAPPSFVWWSGIAVGIGYPPPYYWVFCPSAFVFAPYPYYYVVTHPAYVRTLGRYSRYYVPASPRLVGPPLSAARVPPSAAPRTRVPVASRVVGSSPVARPWPGPRGASPARPSAPQLGARPAGPVTARVPAAGAPVSRARPASPPRVPPPSAVYAPRTYAPPRSGAPARTYAPSATPRTYAPSATPRTYAPSAVPRTYAPPRVYAPPARAPAPAPRVYSPPARVYSPPSRVYSPPSRVYSPSHGYSPSRGSGSSGHRR